MPSGATLETTDEEVAGIEDKLSGIEEIMDIVSTIEEEEAMVTLISVDQLTPNDLTFCWFSLALTVRMCVAKFAFSFRGPLPTFA